MSCYPRPIREIHIVELTTHGCLYRIDFRNGKSYIGISAFGLTSRMAGHLNAARRKSPKAILHKAMAKYGSHAYSVKMLVIADDFEYLKKLEIKAICVFNTKVPNGYNMTDGGDGQLGKEWSAKSREKLAAKRRGCDYLTPEARAAVGLKLRGRQFSAEHRRRLSLASTGNHGRYGQTLSDEHKAKITAKALGRKHSEKTKAKLSAIVKTWWAQQ